MFSVIKTVDLKTHASSSIRVTVLPSKISAHQTRQRSQGRTDLNVKIFMFPNFQLEREVVLQHSLNI